MKKVARTGMIKMLIFPTRVSMNSLFDWCGGLCGGTESEKIKINLFASSVSPRTSRLKLVLSWTELLTKNFIAPHITNVSSFFRRPFVSLRLLRCVSPYLNLKLINSAFINPIN